MSSSVQTDKQNFLKLVGFYNLPATYVEIEENDKYWHEFKGVHKDTRSIIIMGEPFCFDNQERFLGWLEETVGSSPQFIKYVPKNGLEIAKQPSYSIEPFVQGKEIYVREGTYFNPINETYVHVGNELCKTVRIWGQSGTICTNKSGFSFLALPGDIITYPTVEKFKEYDNL